MDAQALPSSCVHGPAEVAQAWFHILIFLSLKAESKSRVLKARTPPLRYVKPSLVGNLNIFIYFEVSAHCVTLIVLEL